ncbi:MAG: flippase-like domain-containing protein [Candidatus Aureabacteria bacterium]|nr:flippase-like domain-containing protein [Candidatus Auribacterota bacterium]
MKKQTKLLLIKALVSLTLIVLLFLKIDLSHLPEIFRDIKISLLFLGFVLLFFNTAISALKWKILLKSDGVDIPFPYLLKSYLIGTFFNLFLPTSIGGDVYRIYDVAKKSQDTSKSAASVFIDRASGFFALSMIGLLAAFFISSAIPDKRLVQFLLIVFSLIVLAFFILFQRTFQKAVLFLVSSLPVQRFRKGLFIKFRDRLVRFFEKVFLSFNTYKSRASVLLKIIGISFLFQSFLIVIVFIYAVSLDYDISVYWFFLFMPAIVVLESIPTPTLYAVGVRDWGYVFFFTHAGLADTQAAALSILYLFMTVIYSLSGGVFFILKRKK